MKIVVRPWGAGIKKDTREQGGARTGGTGGTGVPVLLVFPVFLILLVFLLGRPAPAVGCR